MAIWVKDRLDEGMTMPEINAYLQDLRHRGPLRHRRRRQLRRAGQGSSTTSRSSTRAATRRPATRPTAPTRSGATARARRWWPVPAACPASGSASGTTASGATQSRRTRPAAGSADYTIQPENGGLGVFAHEFGHDLGLPDLYDTSGNTGGAENNTGFWTLMSSGANIGDGGPDGIGDAPTDLDAWSSSISAGSTRRATRARSTRSSTPERTARSVSPTTTRPCPTASRRWSSTCRTTWSSTPSATRSRATGCGTPTRAATSRTP